MQIFNNPEKTEYQKSIAAHPMRQHVAKIVDVNHRGGMTAVVVTFYDHEDPNAKFITLSGVSNRCPTDEQDTKMGFLVAFHNCLQRAKQYL